MTKIVIAQTDSIIGKIAANAEKIKKIILKAKTNKADLVIFPPYTLCGYPVRDLLLRNEFLYEEIENELNEISKISNNLKVILCEPRKNENASVFVISNKTINSDSAVFIDGEEYSILTGEFLEKNLSSNIIHLDTSASECGKEYIKNSVFSAGAKTNGIYYIYVNKVGYGDNLVFDGASRIYDTEGNITACAKSFEEDFLVIENLKGRIEPMPTGQEISFSNEFSLDYTNDLDRLYKELICGIKGYFSKNCFTKAVLGLSGGLDSTICAVLLTKALGKENVIGISMPTNISSKGSKDDAKKLAQNLGITYLEVSIAEEVEVFKNKLENIYGKILFHERYKNSTTIENLQARTRATILWSVANEYSNMLPVATSDKSECYIGYATVNGDMSGGFAPIADVTKTRLFALGNYINNMSAAEIIPRNILQKPPGAELKFDSEKGRTITAEEDNMPYAFLDEVIWNIENFGFGKDELLNRTFVYEKNHEISEKQKSEWLTKFFNKYSKAVFKWHIMPPSIITEPHTLNQAAYYHPIV